MIKRDPEKLRAWQQRSRTRLKTSLATARKFEQRDHPIRKINKVRAAKRRKEDFGERADMVIAHPCHVFEESPVPTPCTGPPGEPVIIVPAHLKSRGAGGDRFDLRALCWGHHGEEGTIGHKAFDAKYQIDSARKVAEMVAKGDALGLP